MDNEKIITKVNEGIMETKVYLTYKEFVDLLKEIQDKDVKIKEKDNELDYLEDENISLKEELEEVEELSESRAELLIKAVDKIVAKDKLIKELIYIREEI